MKINDIFVDDYVSIKNRHMSVEQKEFDFYNENVNEENRIDFKSIEKRVDNLIMEYRKENKFKVLFPHLKNICIPLLNIEQKDKPSSNDLYLVFMILCKEQELYSCTQDYYTYIIKENNYGIPQELFDKKIFTPSNIQSSNYNMFVEALANWYTKSEIVMFNFTLLNKYFNICFDSNLKETISSIQNFEMSLSLFSQKNILKLAGFIFSSVSGDPDLPQMTVAQAVSLIKKKITKSNNIIPFSLSQVGMLMGMYCVYSISKGLGKKMKEKSETLIIDKITSIVDSVNNQLETLIRATLALFDCEIRLFLGNSSSIDLAKKLDDEIKEKENLVKAIINYLKNVPLEDDLNFLVLGLEQNNSDDWVDIDINQKSNK